MDRREDVKCYYPDACGKDKREDSGNYYPGGSVVPQGKVPSHELETYVQKQEGLEVKTGTITDLRNAVKDLARAMGATLVSVFAAMVASAADVQTAKLGEIDLDSGPSVVTNVVFDGLATAADLAAKRDKTDMDVYEVQVGDWRVVQVSDGSDPATWTIRTAGVNPGVYEIYSITRPNLPGEIFFNNLNYEGKTSATVSDTIADVRYEINIERTTTVPTGDQLATTGEVAAVAATIPQTVTNVVRDVQGLVWDEKLGITWKQVMYDGNLYYVAVTNANITEVTQ